MAYWLVKSEPFKYSWDQFVKDGKATWDGVRNYAARNNLQAMKKGDEVFFYHSNEGLAIVGIAKVIRESYPDPTTEEEAWVVVDIKPVRKLKNPVTLKDVKAEGALSEMALLKLSRLSVQPVREEEWLTVLEMSAVKK
jgi:predicted RNA-binding protein with PUA-like domain